MRVLGIDYGSARMGLAIGDTDSGIASPWTVWEGKALHEPALFEALRELMEKEEVKKIVVGMPRMLADREQVTDQMREIRAFVERLQTAGFDVEEADETWSSVTAARQMQERGEKGKRDDLAAAVMLEAYLSRK